MRSSSVIPSMSTNRRFMPSGTGWYRRIHRYTVRASTPNSLAMSLIRTSASIAATLRFLMAGDAIKKSRTRKCRKAVDIPMGAPDALAMKAGKPRNPTAPEPGFYLVRMRKGAWEVPASISLTDGIYRFVIDGEEIPGEFQPQDLEVLVVGWLMAEASGPIARLLMWGRPTDELTYRHRLAVKSWAQQWEPDHPCLHPNRPISEGTIPITEF